MRVRLLGPVDVLVDGTPRPVRGLRRKAVLAALSLHPGEIVSTDRLVDIVWGDAAPATAPATLQSHVSHLRRVLGERVAIVALPPGYVLDVGTPATDVQAAEWLMHQAAQSSALAERETRLQAAVALWRGRPLADLTELGWFDDHANRLEQLLLQARHTLVDARLALGQHAQLIPELEILGGQYPLHEQIQRQLILALYRAGRQGDALAAYQRLRTNLRQDLGIDPGQESRDLETAILRQDASLDTTPPSSVALAGAVPAQLPPAITGFTGRRDELAHLDRLLPDPQDGGSARPTSVVISAISGTAGIGKTTLAVHWAHTVAHRYPGGQLYANLRGFDPAGTATDPATVLGGFLDALGTPAERIPADPDARAAMYRSQLAGRRVLILLDNARDAAQVRPLLPGAPGCLVLVTSRNPLSGLIAVDGARSVTVDLMSADEAREMLAGRLGAARVAAEPDAVHEIVASCARLPLALAIVTARAAIHPRFPLADLARELRDSVDILDALGDQDPTTDIRAVFSWSYRHLGPAAARLFRLLGLHPGPDISAAAAASLAGLTPAGARKLLVELGATHLAIEHSPDRFTLHDLLRAYAADLARSVDSDEQRHAATHRVLDHYLHTAHAADRLLEPARVPIVLLPPQPGVRPEQFDGHDQAVAWFVADHPVLLAAVDLADTAGLDTHTWQLAWALWTYLRRRGFWQEQIVTQRLAVMAAGRAADLVARARARRNLADAYIHLGRYDEAQTELQDALDLFRDIRDEIQQGHTLHSIAYLAERRGRPAEALRQAELALKAHQAAGHRHGQADVLNSIGWYHALLGDHPQAINHCRQALALLEEFGDLVGQAATWDSLGYAHQHLDDQSEAVNCYKHALALFEQAGDRYGEADTLSHLGDTRHAAGDLDGARRAWQRARSILTEIDHPDVEDLRRKLSALAGT